MIKYTTPTITLTIEGVDLTGQDIYVSIEQGQHELMKHGSDLTVTTETVQQVTNTIVTFTLAQEETADFCFNKGASVQVNWINAAGKRAATEIKTIGVMRNLLDEVISYGD